ncbi:MAG TPA: hypothetical protein VMV95_03650 [Bacillota bacterium]|nr:hypothetical protein [Bacillota bacterium]
MKCYACEGSGKVSRMNMHGGGASWIKCWRCEGTGKLKDEEKP